MRFIALYQNNCKIAFSDMLIPLCIKQKNLTNSIFFAYSEDKYINGAFSDVFLARCARI